MKQKKSKKARLQNTSQMSFNQSNDSTSNHSKKLKCTPLDQYNVTSITSHCGFIVTASRIHNNDIKVWTEKFELVCTQPMKHVPSIVVSWGDLLVVGTSNTIEYWKLKESNSEYTLEVEREIPEDCIEEAVVWNDMLLTRHQRKLVQNYFYLWNKQGEKVKDYSKEIRGFNFSVASNILYLLGGSGFHKFQIDPQDHSKLVKASFDVDENVSAMCLWGKDRLACIADYLVYLVTLTGKIIAKFDLGVRAIAIASWGDKLAVVTSSNKHPLPMLIVWNWDGSVFNALPLDGHITLGTLFGYNKSLWLGSLSYLRAFTLRRDWNTERLLWIGNMKNNPEECHIALLPKEIVVHIASFLLE